MFRIRDLRDEEVITRLLAIDKAELAEYLLALARQHPRNGRLVQDLLNHHAEAYAAGLEPARGLPEGEPGLDERELLALQVESLKFEHSPIRKEQTAGFIADLARLLDKLGNAVVDPHETAELVQRIIFSKENMIDRCDGNWAELREWIDERPRKLYRELLQRCTDMEFVCGSLVQHFELLDREQDEAMEEFAIKLLSPEALKLLVNELMSCANMSRSESKALGINCVAANLASHLSDLSVYRELRDELEEYGVDLPEL